MTSPSPWTASLCRLIFALFLLAWPEAVPAQGDMPKNYVEDRAGIIDAGVRQALDARLQAAASSSSEEGGVARSAMAESVWPKVRGGKASQTLPSTTWKWLLRNESASAWKRSPAA